MKRGLGSFISSKRSKVEPKTPKKKRKRGKEPRKKKKTTESGKTINFAFSIFNERRERAVIDRANARVTSGMGKKNSKGISSEPIIRLIPSTLGEEEIEVAIENASTGRKSVVTPFSNMKYDITARFPSTSSLTKFINIKSLEDFKN